MSKRELLASLVVFTLACSDPSAPREPLVIPATNQTLEVPRTLPLSTQAGRDTRTVLWESSDQAVASVSVWGVVTARFPGSVTITARRGLQSATLTLQVTAASIDIGPNPVIVALNGMQRLTAIVRDADGAALGGLPVSWSTADASIAAVGATTGVVTGIATGITEITATGGGASGVVEVVVDVSFAARLLRRR